MKHSTDFLGEKSFRAYEDGFRACAKRLTDEGLDLTRYGLAQQVDDMEAARKALGYDRIDLLSESAGTRTALIYAWRHPQRIHRSVMIGVNPPGHFLWDRKTTDEQLGRYAASARRTRAVERGPTTSPPRCGGRPRTCPTAGSSCRSRRAPYGSSRSTGSWSRRRRWRR